jgi:hypothetical protein
MAARRRYDDGEVMVAVKLGGGWHSSLEGRGGGRDWVRWGLGKRLTLL